MGRVRRSQPNVPGRKCIKQSNALRLKHSAIEHTAGYECLNKECRDLRSKKMDIDDCNYKLFSKSDLSSSFFDATNPGGLLKTQTEDLHQKSDALISSILWQSEKNTAIQLEVNFRPKRQN